LRMFSPNYALALSSLPLGKTPRSRLGYPELTRVLPCHAGPVRDSRGPAPSAFALEHDWAILLFFNFLLVLFLSLSIIDRAPTPVTLRHELPEFSLVNSARHAVILPACSWPLRSPTLEAVRLSPRADRIPGSF